MRVAKPAVPILMLGFVGGPLSVWWLRDWTPMSSFHALIGGTAALLFFAAAAHGRRLEHGNADARSAHALLGVLGVLAGLVAAVAGFVLLP